MAFPLHGFFMWDNLTAHGSEGESFTKRLQINVYNVHVNAHTRKLQKITEKRLKWYGHVGRMKEEHTVRKC